MNNLAFKYNRLLIIVVAFAPFVSWFTVSYLDMDFERIIQLLSFLGIFLLVVLKEESQSIKFPKYLLFYLLFIFYNFDSEFLKLDRTFEINSKYILNLS